MKCIDLFSGLGGFSLAAHWNGIETACFVEKDERCRSFLSRAWPGVPIYDDIKTFPAEEYAGADFVFGGPPCQPASRAGKQRGKEDDRWLWPQTIDVVKRIKPRWCLLESPPGIGDVDLSGILSELGDAGYEVRVIGIPACAVGSPQIRNRYWIICCNMGFANKTGRIAGRNVSTSSGHGNSSQSDACIRLAHPDHPGRQGANTEPGEDGLCSEHLESDCVADTRPASVWAPERPEQCSADRPGDDPESELADPGSVNDEQRGTVRHDEAKETRTRTVNEGLPAWDNFVWMPCADGKVRRAIGDSQRMAYGLPVELLETLGAEGRQTPEECEVHRSILGALGNSIVPQVAYQIIKAMVEADNGRM